MTEYHEFPERGVELSQNTLNDLSQHKGYKVFFNDVEMSLKEAQRKLIEYTVAYAGPYSLSITAKALRFETEYDMDRGEYRIL